MQRPMVMQRIMEILNQMEEGVVLTNYQYEPWFINTSAQKSLALKSLSEWRNSSLLLQVISLGQSQEKAYFTTYDSDRQQYFVYKEKTPQWGYKFVIAKMQAVP